MEFTHPALLGEFKLGFGFFFFAYVRSQTPVFLFPFLDESYFSQDPATSITPATPLHALTQKGDMDAGTQTFLCCLLLWSLASESKLNRAHRKLKTQIFQM